jgi:hypothetical protein
MLTAEIRVLQVGSKPVTLSAARQLDSVDATAIKPFGRVRIDPKPATGLIEVIGSVNWQPKIPPIPRLEAYITFFATARSSPQAARTDHRPAGVAWVRDELL